MAERGYTPVSVIPLWKARSLSAGDAATSDVIDLRFAAQNGFFSLYSSVAAGTAGTVGTTVFTYIGCSQPDGVFVAPSNSIAIGTRGTALAANLASFEPEPMPFMKIVATQSGAGTAGKDSKITADLIVQ
jgi:hypothetical protein